MLSTLTQSALQRRLRGRETSSLRLQRRRTGRRLKGLLLSRWRRRNTIVLWSVETCEDSVPVVSLGCRLDCRLGLACDLSRSVALSTSNAGLEVVERGVAEVTAWRLDGRPSGGGRVEGGVELLKPLSTRRGQIIVGLVVYLLSFRKVIKLIVKVIECSFGGYSWGWSLRLILSGA